MTVAVFSRCSHPWKVRSNRADERHVLHLDQTGIPVHQDTLSDVSRVVILKRTYVIPIYLVDERHGSVRIVPGAAFLQKST